jgi:hypothetical protein
MNCSVVKTNAFIFLNFAVLSPQSALLFYVLTICYQLFLFGLFLLSIGQEDNVSRVLKSCLVSIMILRLLLLHICSLFTVVNSFRTGPIGPRRYVGSIQRNEVSYFFTYTIRTKARIRRLSETILKAALNNANGPPTSLKLAAIPLLDAGKALARTGELLIDLTTELNLYGGALSAAGAGIRNAGDNIAQAAASCRFKTANELVIDELREAALALSESTSKFQLAVDEAKTDQNDELAARIGTF